MALHPSRCVQWVCIHRATGDGFASIASLVTGLPVPTRGTWTRREGAGCGHRSPPFPSGQACSSAQGPVGTCRACPPGTFSPGDISCSAHTRCRAGNRILVAPGTAMTDSRCGACLPG
uniref:Uncharacterized protein n=1 Tax=Accipiter nisus TaxID=211598 RepID=A0A8B9MAC4_9AVES